VSPAGRHVFFVPCARGLEPVLHAEAKGLRLARVERQVGGVRFEGTLADAWRANLELRTAVRVLWRLARFPAPDGDALHAGVSAVDWASLIAPEGTLWVDAQVRDSALTHSLFVAQRTKDAVVDQLSARTGHRPSVERESPDLRLHVHLFRDRATLSVDTSGDSLHKRGWRRAQGRAPLAETLAAGIVALSGWQARGPFLDPFAGSGTLAIEAGLIAARIAPGLMRSFAFERLPGHDARAFAALKKTLADRRAVPKKVRIHGSDSDPERVAEARANVAAAGLEELVTLEVADAREFAPRRGWDATVVSNPPYGERLGDAARLVPLYRAFGERLRERAGGFGLALLTSAKEHERALALGGLRQVALQNGGLDCTLLVGRIEAARTAREPKPKAGS
jgi:23S rRNA G2445 N2-methylase RlmL